MRRPWPRSVSFLIVAVSAIYALLRGRLDRAGVTRAVGSLNNDDCFAVPGLEACEDVAWVDQESGTAYL